MTQTPVKCLDIRHAARCVENHPTGTARNSLRIFSKWRVEKIEEISAREKAKLASLPARLTNRKPGRRTS